MTRVVRRGASAWRAPSRAMQRRARKHKVIMESMTQEKKKLRSVISFEAKAPTGYTFIPAGNPHLTTACKEWCRKEGCQIYAVSVIIFQVPWWQRHVQSLGFTSPVLGKRFPFIHWALLNIAHPRTLKPLKR
ncbi:hypothetical protein N7478_007305 [Penicillium angulare]|uniref:uncharacterized protein n=1 Tax=Penicillium angulare TaxID=116970 RepID=UPI00254087AB|nr:uncharacterized protein N7478_007305 [Penicillium angulare]KAJ5281933.1 hypothetical protein N7478_007305 [Penicillium angulare]